MAKVINISDKFNKESPAIRVGDKEYKVNDGISVVTKLEEVLGNKDANAQGILKAFELTLGTKACTELGVKDMSLTNITILLTGIMAAIQGINYEAAEARFREDSK